MYVNKIEPRQCQAFAVRRFPFWLAVTLAALAALLAGCGGGGGGGGTIGGGGGGSTITVQGTASETLTGVGVNGITVTLKGTKNTTTTANDPVQGDGWYSLSGVPAGTAVTLVYDDTATSEVHDVTFVTGAASPQTENVNYAFLEKGPP